jgi:hypothetical protein
MQTRPTPTGVTYAQATKGQIELPQNECNSNSHNELDTTNKRPNRTPTNDENTTGPDGQTHQFNNDGHKQTKIMAQLLKIAIWNANVLCQHAQEINLFLQAFHLQILLVSETHLTERSHIKIPNCNMYHTTHPDKTARRGTAVIDKTLNIT